MSRITLGTTVAVCLILVGLADSETVLRRIRTLTWEQNRTKKQIPLFAFNEHYVDYEERFIHQDLSSADYSRGGVYFFGASTMKWALKPWDIPPEIQPYIHNYAWGGSKHSDNYDLIRYLVEKEGMASRSGKGLVRVCDQLSQHPSWSI